ncbi:hypothetical protein C8Q76DRAFT_792425 [Earliella scabrosa]|nr:hypothetical protein C8Q76DRAFT_792425 [Earliella scabrosa]
MLVSSVRRSSHFLLTNMQYLPAKPAVRVTSAQDLLDFEQAVKSDWQVASLARDLTIVLCTPFPIDALRFCLLSSINVVDLILILPPFAFDEVLTNVHFSRLELLKTNLPHRFLAPFLVSHNTITDLCLDGCGRAPNEQCPLRHLDLGHVTTVECGNECVVAASHSALLRLTAEHMGDASPSPTTFLRTVNPPLAALFELKLDFFPDDYDLLDQIVMVAPRLQRLKLLERPREYRRNVQSRRSWNHSTRWSNSLFRLDCLKDFALRTASELTSPPMSVAKELLTVKKWSTKITRPSRSVVCKHAHPTLTYLRLWYRCEEAGGGIMTSWSKTSGTWRNTSRISNPPPDTPF